MSNIILLGCIIVFVFLVWYVKYSNVELMIEGYALTKKVNNIYDVDPNYYDYYDYKYTDWIPTMDLVRPRAIWPELQHYDEYMLSGKQII